MVTVMLDTIVEKDPRLRLQLHARLEHTHQLQA
jgi:hypothetical protein